MTASNPLDDALLDGDTDDSMSKEEALGHYMASLGFRPKDAKAKDTVEYYKTYSDPSGRIGRAVVVVKKDEVGIEPKEPEYITVTVQIHIPANDQEVRGRAPAFCKQDILRILAHFATRSERREAEVIECALCGLVVAEFVERDGAQVCHDCSKRKGL